MFRDSLLQRYLSLIFAFIFVSCTASDLKSQGSIVPTSSNFRGWDYLVEKLLKDGFSFEEVSNIFSDSRMPHFENIPFSLAPRETGDIYKGFLSSSNISLARRYLKSYSSSFSAAEKRFSVSKHIIAAILLIESRFGENTGDKLVIYRLARLASVRAPGNVDWNFKRLHSMGLNVTFKEVESRAKYLENTFYPEVRALLILAREKKIDPLALRGSSAGAIGIPQFLPSNYITLAVDGNKNKRVSLFEMEDGIFSVANFLNYYGWRDDLPIDEKRSILWRYNKSEAYIDTVLRVKSILKSSEN